MKPSIFKQKPSNSIFKISFSILLVLLFFTISANAQNHCLVIKNVGINTLGGTQNPDCDGTFLNGCQPSEFIELFNTCDTAQNFGCYVVCSGEWCVRIPANIPDLPPSGTIVLGSTFSPGFDVNNPFHIDIRNCNNCSWLKPGIGIPAQVTGVLLNAGGEIVLYDDLGNLEMGVNWGNSANTYGNLNAQFADGCPNQNITLDFPDPNGNPEFIDLGNLAETDACAISIGCATIDDNSVSAAMPEALCDADGENSAIGGSNPFTQIGPISTGSSCFYEANMEFFGAYYEPQNFSPPPQINWSSSTGLLFGSIYGPVSSTTDPLAEVIFTSAGNHTITMALQFPGDDCIYYHTEDIFVEESVDLSDLMVCLGTDFTIENAPPNLELVALAVISADGTPITAPQTMLPATFNIPENMAPGIYMIRYILGSPSCNVDVAIEVLAADQCPQNCDDVAIIGLPQSVTNASSITLNATPAGGVFSGEGVVFNAFNPSLVSPGIYQITYTYTNDDGCNSAVSENIFVVAISFNFVNYNLGTISPKIRIDIDVFEDDVQPVTVTNVDGRTLFEANKWLNKGNQNFTIDANGWSKGVYFVQIGRFNKPEKVYVF